MHEEVAIPPDLAVRFEELVEKLVQTMRYSTTFPSGPQLTIQIIFLTIIRIGATSNPDVMEKLKLALDVAWEQFKDES